MLDSMLRFRFHSSSCNFRGKDSHSHSGGAVMVTVGNSLCPEPTAICACVLSFDAICRSVLDLYVSLSTCSCPSWSV